MYVFEKQVEIPDDLKAEMFPHHMEKWEDISYHSYSILGQIYDKVEAFRNDIQLQKGEQSLNRSLNYWWVCDFMSWRS